MGVTVALQAALAAKNSGEKIFVLLDNQAAVRALQTGKSSFCLRTTQLFNELARKAKVQIRWVPGHSKINVNKEADAATRSALSTHLARIYHASKLASIDAPASTTAD